MIYSRQHGTLLKEEEGESGSEGPPVEGEDKVGGNSGQVCCGGEERRYYCVCLSSSV